MATESKTDSVVYPERVPASSTLEKIVSFPGQLAYAPVRYTVLGLGYAGVYLVESGVIEKLSSVINRSGFVPVYAPRTGGGVKYISKDFATANALLIFEATSWTDFRQRYSIQWKNFELARGLYSDYVLRYRLLTDEDFFGIGPHSREEDELYYSAEDALFEATLRRHISKSFYLKLDLGVSNTSVFKRRDGDEQALSDVYSDSMLPGLREKVRLQGTELSIRYDDTNHPGHPSAGRLGKLGATLFTDIRDDRFSFWKLGVDVTQHVHLFNDRTLVLRGAGELTQGFDDPDIPFYHLAELGSHGTIRGFTRGRFRDKDYVLGSAEYRYPVWIPWAKVVDALIFVDGGQVANNIFEDGAIADWQVGYGGGFRFYSEVNLIASTEIAFSKEGYRFYLTLNTP